MTPSDADAPSPATASTPVIDPTTTTSSTADAIATTGTATSTAPETQPGDIVSALTALGWVNADVVRAPEHQAHLPGVGPVLGSGLIVATADLLATRPRRSALRPGVLIPLGLVILILLLYCGITLFWPLNAIPPRLAAATVTPVPAAAAKITWPSAGSGAVAVQGFDGSAASTPQASPMASITKLVTALTVLDQMPLDLGQQGPLFHFTSADRAQYQQYLRRNESALNVPVGGTLSEYQMLQGMLIGSASNYAARLAGNLWPNDAVFANAAQTWLQNHGVAGITVVDPTGFQYGNTATPAALITLAQKALQNPVIAEIVAMPSVDLPGAGHVVNTNGLILDPGVIGVKTGTLDGYDLLAAKKTTVGGTAVTMYATTLVQPNDGTRLATTRDLFDQVEKELQLHPSVTAGTQAGTVTTRWGASVAVVTATDADVVLWNGGAATVSSTFALGHSWAKGAAAGTMTATGPLDSTSVKLVLARPLQGPSPWWRLTHPLDLLGLN